MILTAHQPNFLPYPGLFHKILNADYFIIVDHVQFVKRGKFGWIHRNRIRTPTGWMWLTIPVKTQGKYYQKIKEVEIDNNLPWRRKIWRSIQLHYKKAPYFGELCEPLENVFNKEWNKLLDINVSLIRIIFDYLEINLPIKLTSELSIDSGGSQLIVDMCRKVNADTYISGIHGRDYLDRTLCERNGIKLLFQEFTPPKYKQVYNDVFIENLSIIDMLFNCGSKATRELLKTAGVFKET